MTESDDALPEAGPADRMRHARIGLTLLGISFLLGARIIGLLPIVLGIFLPRFRVLGWWITVVFTLFTLAISVGGAVYVARNFQQMRFQAPEQTIYATALIGLAVVSCFLALFGLLSPGTRREVERRTKVVAPHAFDPPQAS